MTVDANRGAISTIFDKQLSRELVDAMSPYLLNQYVYVSGGDGTRLVEDITMSNVRARDIVFLKLFSCIRLRISILGPRRAGCGTASKLPCCRR
jgi:hypothetical protein